MVHNSHTSSSLVNIPQVSWQKRYWDTTVQQRRCWGKEQQKQQGCQDPLGQQQQGQHNGAWQQGLNREISRIYFNERDKLQRIPSSENFMYYGNSNYGKQSFLAKLVKNFYTSK
eukprot:TRINITY_DN25592_c1_g1_i2.p5 TRINITY_DN25592_c1_g1~~TRINITY_DN25592_c1_g1_i2.p5  ORF type:complete len:114 (-),score=3.63 TRINITY_DN25592_c1_g1_i2:498-839(-)